MGNECWSFYHGHQCELGAFHRSSVHRAHVYDPKARTSLRVVEWPVAPAPAEEPKEKRADPEPAVSGREDKR